jgi:hypothetical protein
VDDNRVSGGVKVRALDTAIWQAIRRAQADDRFEPVLGNMLGIEPIPYAGLMAEK